MDQSAAQITERRLKHLRKCVFPPWDKNQTASDVSLITEAGGNKRKKIVLLKSCDQYSVCKLLLLRQLPLENVCTWRTSFCSAWTTVVPWKSLRLTTAHQTIMWDVTRSTAWSFSGIFQGCVVKYDSHFVCVYVYAQVCVCIFVCGCSYIWRPEDNRVHGHHPSGFLRQNISPPAGSRDSSVSSSPVLG